MTESNSLPTESSFRCELEFPIAAPAELVWQALLEETNAWWLSDFHMVGTGSRIAFDLSPGGKGLFEVGDAGSFLQWYQVQACLPARHTIFLSGDLAPEFGGPSRSSLRLSVLADDDGTRLSLLDAHFGDVNAATVSSLRDGWQRLFTEGLQKYVEQKSAAGDA